MPVIFLAAPAPVDPTVLFVSGNLDGVKPPVYSACPLIIRTFENAILVHCDVEAVSALVAKRTYGVAKL